MRAAPPRVITVWNADAMGVTRSRVRTEVGHGNWQHLARGIVLTRPDEPTREDWAAVGIAVAGPGAAVSGWDAVRARGAGDARPPSDRVLVLSPAGTSRVVGGVQIRPTERAFRRSFRTLGSPLAELPLVHVARAVSDTALDHRRNINAVRALVSRILQLKLCTIGELVVECESGPRRHSASLRQALLDAADGARSVAEVQAAQRLARGPIPAFELNVPVVDQFGRLLYEVDVLWRALRAGLEIDSRRHHSDLLDWENTMDRHNQLTGYRLALLHFPPSTITRTGGPFIRDVARFLSGRAAELGVPLPTDRGVIRPETPDGRPLPLIVHR